MKKYYSRKEELIEINRKMSYLWENDWKHTLFGWTHAVLGDMAFQLDEAIEYQEGWDADV